MTFVWCRARIGFNGLDTGRQQGLYVILRNELALEHSVVERAKFERRVGQGVGDGAQRGVERVHKEEHLDRHVNAPDEEEHVEDQQEGVRERDDVP